MNSQPLSVLWAELEAAGEQAIRERLVSGNFGRTGAKREQVEEWLRQKDQSRTDAAMREQAAIARDAASSARLAAEEARTANTRAQTANKIAIIAIAIATISAIAIAVISAIISSLF